MENWRKSSYSDATGGNCVEVACIEVVAVRDTQDRDGATLAIGASAWAAFTASLR
jgi:Domain of unknown function (DUF397)